MPDFKDVLATYKKGIDEELEKYFDKEIKNTQKEDKLIADALTQVKRIALAGGKRIRGALLLAGYLGGGGKDKKRIMKVAVSAELIHLFLLVHDDIMDRGDNRHGIPTLHKKFSLKKQKGESDEEALHFGNSIAIILGDMLYSQAMKMVVDAGLNSENTLHAVSRLLSFSGTTIVGQSQDISIQKGSNVSERQVLAMYENKTARYTFECPLHVGMLFAGVKDKKTFKAVTDYSIPIGIAFQIQDDILGVFGDEKKMGKSAASDIEEGKISLLVVKAREFGNKSQKANLNSILGKKNLKKDEIEEFKKILKDTGALLYAQNMALNNMKKGKKEIEKAVLLKPTKDFLVGLAEYLENRQM
jgi:geranylgeranyl diphosphate synthase type I